MHGPNARDKALHVDIKTCLILNPSLPLFCLLLYLRTVANHSIV